MLKEKLGILHLPVKTLSVHTVLSYNVNTILFINRCDFVINAEIPFKNQKSCNISLREAVFVVTHFIHFKASVPMSDNFNQNVKNK